ncbi:DUF418 domain-containing protein [Leucobacter albus]|uniref:DUF418 domain-containing protein n=1 Tax=Leucobacter albus TaxID=272210 RepID=A0ABW3TM63_9MICO
MQHPSTPVTDHQNRRHATVSSAGHPPAGTPSGSAPRIASLDVLRGIALAGILPVNVQAIASWGYDAPVRPFTGEAAPIDFVTGLVFEGRMMPLFAILFGIGFALFLASAGSRTARPRVVLARRLGFLAVVGVLHHLIYPGEVLAFYAVAGLVILLPASFLPRWVPLVAGVALTAAGAPFGGPMLLPGLFLLGAAIVRYDALGTLERRPMVHVTAFTIAAVAAAGVTMLQLDEIALGSFSKPGRIAGVLTMFALALGVLLLMRSRPLARALTAVFAPLGRMAFTNYLTATLLVVALALAINAPEMTWLPEYGYLVALAIIPVQWAWSVLWLKHFRYGPLEWVWRTVTWWAPQPLRK